MESVVFSTNSNSEILLFMTAIRENGAATELSMLIDTSTDLTWVTCNPCDNCPKSIGLGIQLNCYDPTSSSAASLVHCLSDTCASLIQSGSSGCSVQSNQCIYYHLEYEDGSRTSACAQLGCGGIRMVLYQKELSGSTPPDSDMLVQGGKGNTVPIETLLLFINVVFGFRLYFAKVKLGSAATELSDTSSDMINPKAVAILCRVIDVFTILTIKIEIEHRSNTVPIETLLLFINAIDIGTDLTWVTCNPCNNCPKSTRLGIQQNSYDPLKLNDNFLLSFSTHQDGKLTSNDAAVHRIWHLDRRKISPVSQRLSQGIAPIAVSHCFNGMAWVGVYLFSDRCGSQASFKLCLTLHSMFSF
ncbi:Xylanase inhibitor, N-terminal [Dillenia turbinata]|uniref:Xylanase inhibitor, N-terminal n=1 Tax=Dillenia turbinata TaxID=194707 RepID=A0AAN8ZPR1_9MAGN